MVNQAMVFHPMLCLIHRPFSHEMRMNSDMKERQNKLYCLNRLKISDDFISLQYFVQIQYCTECNIVFEVTEEEGFIHFLYKKSKFYLSLGYA